MSSDASEVIRQWGESAPYWEKHRSTIREMFKPVTYALSEACGIRQGDHVLDVAGGAGEPSLTIAENVRSAKIWSTDAVEAMVAGAKSGASRLGITNVQFCQCLGDALPFPDRFFDVAVSRFGVMFFPDPLSAVREMLRVVKPGRRIAFAVWHTSESNPFHNVVAAIVSRYIYSPAIDPDAPGAFRFATPGKLAAVLQKAGAVEVSERLLQFTIEATKTPEEFWQLRSEMSEVLRDKIARLSPEFRMRLKEDMLNGLLKFFFDGKMRIPAEVLIVSGSVSLLDSHGKRHDGPKNRE
jgi:ubiquinone/menaquinone biosynthesis C-methylase UbiE